MDVERSTGKEGEKMRRKGEKAGWRFGFGAILLPLLVFAGCAGDKHVKIDLMPAPDIYETASIDPFGGSNPLEKIPYSGMLYATDRALAGEDDDERFYKNDRGNVVRLGVGNVDAGEGGITWEEARRISLLKNRSDKYPLKVTGIQEFGILDRSYTFITEPEAPDPEASRPREHFTQLINDKLRASRKRDVFIYVHGFKVTFENPILVATELWHFLGYEGAFIAYAWPSTPSNTAYLKDVETAALSAASLRKLVEYLAEETEAERIHIVGYSAGTRVVIECLAQLALKHFGKDRAALKRALGIGHVILVGSDFDRDRFGSYLADGMLNVPEDLTVYVSEKDSALGMSKLIFARQRLGQVWAGGNIPLRDARVLERHRNLRAINVTGAQGATSGNGHGYFRKSPWVSSDILITLMYDLKPEERGLVHHGDGPVWTYPENYIENLTAALKKANPKMFRSIDRSR